MAEAKTKPTETSADGFIDAVADPARRRDAQAVRAMLARITGEEPVMWGPSIVGFGRYHYRYDSGREGTACRIGFSPRKGQLVLYLLAGDDPQEAALLARLGKHKIGKSCLYINRLAEVDADVLETLARRAWARMNALHPE